MPAGTNDPEGKPRLKVLLELLMWPAIIVGAVSFFGVFFTFDLNSRGDLFDAVNLPLLITTGICCLILNANDAWSRSLLEKEKKDYHGSAGFAGEGDVGDLINYTDERAPLEGGNFALAPASPAGRIELPRKIVTRHVAVLGPSGAGKSYSFFMPNCAWTRGASFVATTTKNELWDVTSGYQANPVKYAPRDPQTSACFNWIPLCTNPHFTLLLARAVMESDGPARGKDAFWVYAESAFLAAVFAHVNTLERPTPASVADFLSAYRTEQFLPILLESPSHLARYFARVFEQTDAKLRGNMITSVMTRIIFLSDPVIRQFTSAELTPPDFGRLRERPGAVYWVLHENDVSALRPLSSLFFTVLMYQVKQGEGKVPVTLYFDEFANIGRIPDFQTEITVARGRDVGLVIGIQAIAQLKALYGEAEARVIFGGCQTKIAMSGLSFDEAELISRELGDATIMIPRFSYTNGSLMSGSSTTFSLADSKRRLLTADEVRRLEEDKLLVVSTNRRPLMLTRFEYSPTSRPAASKALGPAQAEVFNPVRSAKPALPPPIPVGQELNDASGWREPEQPGR